MENVKYIIFILKEEIFLLPIISTPNNIASVKIFYYQRNVKRTIEFPNYNGCCNCSALFPKLPNKKNHLEILSNA